MKRQRGRGRKPQNQGNRSFESNGPEVKIRGNPSQIYDKYLQLARDASTSGDRVRAENLYQHAEHYYRIVQANMPKRDPNQDDAVEGQDGDGEEGRGEQPQREQREPRRGRGRNDRNQRHDRNTNREQRNPMDVVTPEASPAATTDGAEPPAAEAEAPAPAEETPRPRTRRPRRPRAETASNGAEASKAEEALKSAGDTADKASDDKTGGDETAVA